VKNTLLMSIDLGTSFIKVGVYEIEGNCIVMESKKSHCENPEPSVYIQDGETFCKIVEELMKNISEKLGTRSQGIEAIAFTGQMAGVIGVDKNWNDVTGYSNTMDTRYGAYGKKMIHDWGENILKYCGTNAPVMAPKIHWIKNEFPMKYKCIAKYLSLTGYVIGKLSDMKIDEAVIDRTYTQWTGLADIENDQWSVLLCSELQVSESVLPIIVNSNTVVGKLNNRISQACGLKQGIPLVAGAGDKPAGCIGAGIVIPGMMVDECASYGALSFCTDYYKPDSAYKRMEVIPSAIPGEFYSHIYLCGSGITVDWFANNFIVTDEKNQTNKFKLLDELAAKVPAGSEGLLAIGMLGGRDFPSDPNIKGAWIGHTWNHRLEHFYRALLESFAYEFGFCMDILTENYPEFNTSDIYVIGGGAESDLWNKIKADVTGKKYIRLSRNDHALLGAAIIAGNAVGIYPSLKETAQKFVAKSSIFYPDEALYDYYRKHIEVYENTYDKLRSVFVDLKNISKSP